METMDLWVMYHLVRYCNSDRLCLRTNHWNVRGIQLRWQSIHILVLLLFVLHHLLVTRLYDYFVTTHIRD